MIQIENFSFGYNRKKLLYKNLSLKLETGKIYGFQNRLLNYTQATFQRLMWGIN